LRLRLPTESSIHFLQKMCGQVMSTTSRSLSEPHRHIIFLLYSSISITSSSCSVLASINLSLPFSLLISRFFFSLSSIIFSTCLSFSCKILLRSPTCRSRYFSSNFRPFIVSFSVQLNSWNLRSTSISFSFSSLISASIFSRNFRRSSSLSLTSSSFLMRMLRKLFSCSLSIFSL
jgi:hypothetical protein